MADERNYYVVCEDDCLFPSMTKEQIIAAIAEATGNTPSGVDDAFITKIKESYANNSLTFWQGSESAFNALGISTAQQIIRMDANHKLYIMPGTGDDSKTDKVQNATEGNLAALDSTGNLIDSGKSSSNLVTKVNGKTGEVTLTASDVGALPTSTKIPSIPSTSNLLKGNGSGGVSSASAGSDYMKTGNIVKQTIVSSTTTPSTNYEINWLYG